MLSHRLSGKTQGTCRDISKERKEQRGICLLFLLNKIDDCIELLCETGRVPEAAFMARTYAPSKVSDVVALWKADLAKVNKKAAEALADPLEFKNLFPDFDLALRAEQAVRAKASVPREPASSFPTIQEYRRKGPH